MSAAQHRKGQADKGRGVMLVKRGRVNHDKGGGALQQDKCSAALEDGKCISGKSGGVTPMKHRHGDHREAGGVKSMRQMQHKQKHC